MAAKQNQRGCGCWTQVIVLGVLGGIGYLLYSIFGSAVELAQRPGVFSQAAYTIVEIGAGVLLWIVVGIVGVIVLGKLTDWWERIFPPEGPFDDDYYY